MEDDGGGGSGETDDEMMQTVENNTSVTNSSTTTGNNRQGGGYRLSDSIAKSQPTATHTDNGTTISTATTTAKAQHEVIPEPPIEQTENVVMIQLRGDSGKMTPRRRFDTTTTSIKNLFTYALATQVVVQDGDSSTSDCDSSARMVVDESFRLVTRFPRRVFRLIDHGDVRLNEIDNLSKQELFLVERI